ncbi:helix-turn-helix domain-containing protein [Actinomycetospora termitidis]|uniref:Helix-turn-helix transcriptional regulator n=1 Tax=Actinomycetospora termitidis TaxID=3053470 RepID=A0ABT7M8J0_9PSEU|nr:helix-turn-helix transcriptional regulator [Actinomycetospora sp. Odt1-22]MDL5156357.1 helix-turn-helix transcriptional regulator [Actinomycetospora sp. Odt1-22]
MALLLREAIGGTIRRARTERRRTLRDVSRDARVSLGYLSEIERGRKEPSSELLAAICDALALPLPDLLDDVAATMRPAPVEPRIPARLADRRLVGASGATGKISVDAALRSAVEEAFESSTEATPGPTPAPDEAAAVTEAEVVDLATDATGPDADEATAEDEVVEPAGELRLVELVTLGRDPVRSAA